MSLTLFTTEQGEWSRAGSVLYAGQADSLPIVFKSSDVVDEVEGRPWEHLSTWLEVLPDEERIGGRYSFHHQGAVVFDFQYRNLRTGKTFHFEETRQCWTLTTAVTGPRKTTRSFCLHGRANASAKE